MVRVAAWVAVWLLCGLVVSLVCQDIVHLCGRHLFCAIDGTPVSRSFLVGLAWRLTRFWEVADLWQGPGIAPMVLMTAFGVSAGLIRYPSTLRWIPIMLAVATSVAVLSYLNDVTNGYGFVQLFSAKIATMVALGVAGVHWDRLLTKYVKAKILTMPKTVPRKASGRRVIDV